MSVPPNPMSQVKPTLVVMSWRGGQRFARCLASIAPAIEYFHRIVLSVTSSMDSPDMHLALDFQHEHPTVEVICTGKELPTMEHQAFWVDYLEKSGTTPDEWIYWLAYDDEVRLTGIREIVDAEGDWPLEPGTVYFGPWAMRHESADTPWDGAVDAPLESWTSFAAQGPLSISVTRWIREQLRQPTYMQMSGSLCPFENFLQVRDGKPKKTGPMRIEMAVAASQGTNFVAEFPTPVSIIYGRSNSDRASYGSEARKEDVHLMRWLMRYSMKHPGAIPNVTGILADAARARIARQEPAQEEWRVRGVVTP